MGHVWKTGLALAGFFVLLPFATQAGVMEIGQAEKHGMKLEAIYIQSVVVEGHGGHNHGGGHGEHAMPIDVKSAPVAPTRMASDIHLEAQIHAMEKNPHGFVAGSWIPYLSVAYTLEKLGSDWRSKGILIPMASSDGPHYGENVKLSGPGRYKVIYELQPPAIPYHVDKETGVAGWWEPFELSWEFNYTGTGKKGGY